MPRPTADWFIEIDGESRDERRTRYRRESAQRHKVDPQRAVKRLADKRAYHASRQQDEARRTANNERAKVRRDEFPSDRKAEIAVDARRRATAWYRANVPRARINCAIRRIAMRNATPAWADQAAIDAFYVESERLTLETGIPHEVDHVIPILGKTVCGLHVHFNLQVLTKAANRAKSNRLIDGEETEGHCREHI